MSLHENFSFASFRLGLRMTAALLLFLLPWTAAENLEKLKKNGNPGQNDDGGGREA